MTATTGPTAKLTFFSKKIKNRKMHLHGTVSTFTAQRRGSRKPKKHTFLFSLLNSITISHATILYAVMHYTIIIVSSLKREEGICNICLISLVQILSHHITTPV